mmetsp:Transcript_72315/g.217331  ORF Transcript_72315/g.217331 Transcript_72315/m.217331 type:complete len:327 (+) Transcript_72315:202-1182(+)
MHVHRLHRHRQHQRHHVLPRRAHHSLVDSRHHPRQRAHLHPRAAARCAHGAPPLPLQPAPAHAPQNGLLSDVQHVRHRLHLPLPPLAQPAADRVHLFHLPAAARARAAPRRTLLGCRWRPRLQRSLRPPLVHHGRDRADERSGGRPDRHPRPHRARPTRQAHRALPHRAARAFPGGDESALGAGFGALPALPLPTRPQGGLHRHRLLPRHPAAAALRRALHAPLLPDRPFQPATRLQAAAAHDGSHRVHVGALHLARGRLRPRVDGHLLLLEAGRPRRAVRILPRPPRPRLLRHVPNLARAAEAGARHPRGRRAARAARIRRRGRR